MKKFHDISGKIAYLIGYPVFKLLVTNSHRAYVVVSYKEEILITKNWLDYKRPWRLPGGGVHENELPLMAASRELKEEVGIEIQPDKLTLLAENIQHKKGYSYSIFSLKLSSRPKLRLQYPEILEAKFVDIKTIKKSELTGEQLNFALTKLGH